MKKLFQTKTEAWISSLGLLALAGLYLRWKLGGGHANIAGNGMALLSLLLFALVCLQFVRRWVAFWTPGALPEPEESQGLPLWLIFGASLLAALLELGLILLWRALAAGDGGALEERLAWFARIDSGNYMAIARYWYAPTALAEERRLVFFPLYPLLTRALLLTGLGPYTAGTAVSLLCFPVSNCLLYKLLLLDYPELLARSALKYTLLLPAAFFFVLPMSESVFFLCCLGSFYLARRGRWLGAGLAGALAAFSRSLGALMLAPLIFEAVAAGIREKKGALRGLLSVAACLLTLLGTGAYLYINWRYTGDPFKFMELEEAYWQQSMGSFFQTLAYQTDNALADLQQPWYTSALGIWIPNVLCSMAALLLMACTARKLRASYSLWFIVYFFFAVAPSFLISGPRYLVAAVPLYPALAELGEKQRAERWIAALCAVGALAYLFCFLMEWNVY